MTIPEASELRQGASHLGVEVDADAIGRIGTFIDLLEIWNRRIRLTGDRSRRVLLRKHVLDSLAVVRELPATGMVIDLGSGGGFPGIILGCARPDLTLRLIEPRRRPTSFLAEAIRTIPLPCARAIAIRGEAAAEEPELAGSARVVTGRALRLDTLLALGLPLLRPDGILVAMQTPAVGESSLGDRLRSLGVGLKRSRDYRLPDGEPRRLLIVSRS